MSIGAEHASLYSLDIHVYTYTLFVDLPESVMFWMEVNYQNTYKYFLPFCGLPLQCKVLNFNKVSLFSLTNSALCVIFV